MAKKKNKKQMPSKKETTVTSVDSATKKVLDKARKISRIYTKKVNASRSNDPHHREGLDYDPIRLNRRITASVNFVDEVKNRLSDLCPDIPDIFYLEDDWLEQNLLPVPSFDYLERYNHTTMAAAIWMLDQVREQGQMLTACQQFPRDERLYDDMEVPDVWDASHSDESLMGMIWVIQHRNDDCVTKEAETGKKKSQPGLDRHYMDLHTTQNNHHQQVPSRKCFDSILTLIPQGEKNRAAQYFESKMWDLLERWYRSRCIYAQEDCRLNQEDIDSVNKAKALLADMERGKDEFRKQMQPKSILIQPQSPMKLLTPHQIRTLEQEKKQLLLRAEQLEAAERDRNRRENELAHTIWHFIDTIGDINTFYYEYLESSYGASVAEIWKDFSIEDPYMLAFGFLYLLEQGSDFPWLYQPSVKLMELCSNALPWRYDDFEEERAGIWDHYDEALDGYAYGYQKANLPKRIKVPELEDWYAMDYEDKTEPEPRYRARTNLAQIVYEATGGIMPRNLYRYEAALEDLSDYGITGKKATHPLLYCMAMLGEVKHRSHVFHLSEPSEGGQVDTPDTTSVEELQKRIQELQQENKQLRQASHDIGRDAREAKKKMAELEAAVASERQELADLRELIFHQQEGLFADELPDDEIEFPYDTQKRIVVFGGHDTWAKEIKPKLPEVRFVDRTMIPNAELIRRADVVWIQTNSLSHAYYYKIIDETRKHHVPVRYFSYASATKCAEQIVWDDRDA